MRWRVRWREAGRGSTARTRTFDRKADAVAFEDELRRRRRLGDLGIFVGRGKRLTSTWPRRGRATHAVTLAPGTAKTYARLYDLHIGPHLGPFKLSELTPELIGRWQADRIAAGAGRTSVLKAMTLLGAILQRALESERIARNPVRMVRGRAAGEAGGAAAAAGDGRGDACGVWAARCDADLGSGVRGAAAAGGARARWQHVGSARSPSTRRRRSGAGACGCWPRSPTISSAGAAHRMAERRPLVFPSASGEMWSVEAYKSWASRASRGRQRKDGTRAGTGGAFGRAAAAAGAEGDAVHAPAFVLLAAAARGPVGDLRGAPDGS